MRARVSQQAPRFSGARFLAGCRCWDDPFRRVIPSIALTFLAFLLALGFRGSNFAQLLRNSATGPIEPSAAGSERPLRRQLRSKPTAESLPERADHTDRGADEGIGLRLDDGGAPGERSGDGAYLPAGE